MSRVTAVLSCHLSTMPGTSSSLPYPCSKLPMASDASCTPTSPHACQGKRTHSKAHTTFGFAAESCEPRRLASNCSSWVGLRVCAL